MASLFGYVRLVRRPYKAFVEPFLPTRSAKIDGGSFREMLMYETPIVIIFYLLLSMQGIGTTC
jgi:hypothetical protein